MQTKVVPRKFRPSIIRGIFLLGGYMEKFRALDDLPVKEREEKIAKYWEEIDLLHES